jgi:hypothetical protein
MKQYLSLSLCDVGYVIGVIQPALNVIFAVVWYLVLYLYEMMPVD